MCVVGRGDSPFAVDSVYLRVRVEGTDALDIYHHHLATGETVAEVREHLQLHVHRN